MAEVGMQIDSAKLKPVAQLAFLSFSQAGILSIPA
jgi:hypothetical protein